MLRATNKDHNEKEDTTLLDTEGLSYPQMKHYSTEPQSKLLKGVYIGDHIVEEGPKS